MTANFLSLPSATFSENRNQKNLFLFAYYSSIGSRFWQSVCLFLLLIILQIAFLPVFAKMTPDTAVSTRYRRKSFPFSVILEIGKWQPGRHKIFLFTLNTTAFPVLPKRAQKKQQIFFKTYCFQVAVWRWAIQFWSNPAGSQIGISTGFLLVCL